MHKRWFQGNTTERAVQFHTDSINYFGEVLVMEGVLFDQNEDGIWKNDPNIESSLDLINHLVVMQSTGKQDSTGRYIFEGDILSIARTIKGVVVYNSVNASYELYNGFQYISVNLGDGKIIGNIWENPEKMEE